MLTGPSEGAGLEKKAPPVRAFSFRARSALYGHQGDPRPPLNTHFVPVTGGYFPSRQVLCALQRQNFRYRGIKSAQNVPETKVERVKLAEITEARKKDLRAGDGE